MNFYNRTIKPTKKQKEKKKMSLFKKKKLTLDEILESLSNLTAANEAPGVYQLSVKP